MRLPFRKPGKFSQTNADPLLTKDKFDELQKKLNHLKKIRPQAASEVARLAELGDFSENVEYQLAKGRLRGVNNAILKIEYQLNHAEIIKLDKNSNSVQIGSLVTITNNKLLDSTKNKPKTFQILGSSETNPQKGIISHLSPIGQALLNHKIGEIVKIQLKNDEIEYKIISIK